MLFFFKVVKNLDFDWHAMMLFICNKGCPLICRCNLGGPKMTEMEKCEFFWWETSQGVKWPILKTLRFWYNGIKGMKSWTSKDILVMDYDWWHFFLHSREGIKLPLLQGYIWGAGPFFTSIVHEHFKSFIAQCSNSSIVFFFYCCLFSDTFEGSLHRKNLVN